MKDCPGTIFLVNNWDVLHFAFMEESGRNLQDVHGMIATGKYFY